MYVFVCMCACTWVYDVGGGGGCLALATLVDYVSKNCWPSHLHHRAALGKRGLRGDPLSSLSLSLHADL